MTRSFLVAVLVAVPSTSVAMGAASLSPVLPVASLQQDTSTFADSATAALVARARSRRREQDQRLGGYTARVHTLAEGRAAWTRFGDGFKLFVYEMTAVLEWQRPNDLRIDVLGARSRSPKIPGMQSREQMVGFWTEAFASEPWFAPRALGDEIEMLGIPEEPAVHPLAPFADRFYRYAIRDSVRLGLPGRTVRAVSVRVKPKLDGPVLVSGDMWLDADSLDLVRLVVTFVGEDLWDDDEDSPVMVSMEADLEYSLLQNAFWLPHRQVGAAAPRVPWAPAVAIAPRPFYVTGLMEPRPFVIEEYVRWSDVDHAGIIFYGSYVRFFEIAETELFRAAGLPYGEVFDRFDIWLPRVHLDCDFHYPARLDDRLQVAAYFTRFGTSSIGINFDVVHMSARKLAATGHEVLVCVSRSQLRPQPLPATLRGELERYALTAAEARRHLRLGEVGAAP